jgi:hypothetical protein
MIHARTRGETELKGKNMGDVGRDLIWQGEIHLAGWYPAGG